MARRARRPPAGRRPWAAGAGYGKARVAHEWKLWTRTVLAAAVGVGLLQAAIWYVGDAGDISSLRAWQSGALRAVAIHALVAVGYTVWPPKAPAGADEEQPSLARSER